MKKFVVAGLVMALSLAPALAMAQTGGAGTSGSGASGSPSGSSPSGTGKGAPSTSPGTPSTAPSNTPGTPAPGGSSTNPSVERSTDKADCERAGGKWQTTQMKCQVGG
jgi:hypothetical protein